MSNIKFDKWLNPSDGTENYKCRAWVNFDGTTTPPTIRGSGNVSSVTRNGTGDYTINFATAMPDANYSISGLVNFDNAASRARIISVLFPPVTSSFRIATLRSDNIVNQDPLSAFLSVFR